MGLYCLTAVKVPATFGQVKMPLMVAPETVPPRCLSAETWTENLFPFTFHPVNAPCGC